MLRHTLLIACTITISQAWVQFPGAQSIHQNPWEDPTPRNLETQTTTPVELPEITYSPQSISTIPSMTTIPIPARTDISIPYHEQLLRWVKRQGGAPVANPVAAQPPPGITQVSPVTVLSMISDGAPVAIPYTQTFAPIPEQWPSPSPGTIGLGTIQGEIGQVHTKTKRDAPQEALVSIQTAASEALKSHDDAQSSELQSELRPLPTRRRLIQRGP